MNIYAKTLAGTGGVHGFKKVVFMHKGVCIEHTKVGEVWYTVTAADGKTKFQARLCNVNEYQGFRFCSPYLTGKVLSLEDTLSLPNREFRSL